MLKRTMLIVLALALVVTPVLAKDMARTSWRAVESQTSRVVTEGFEDAFPPTGWTIESPSGHGGEMNWFQSDESVNSGVYCAQVNFDPALIDQDCRMVFDHAVVEGEDHLNFWVSASAYWMTNYTLKVLVDGAEVFDLATEYGASNWVWTQFDVDLSASIGQTVTITFQYLGNDGAAVYLDDVALNEGVDVPPPPQGPENDTCEGAITIEPGEFFFEGDLTAAVNDYDPGSGGCTGYAATGNDAVYFLHLEPGDHISATYNTVADGSMYLITDCADPVGSCIYGVDDTLGGEDEVIEFTNNGDTSLDLYLIVDCFGSGNGGPFTLTGNLEGTVAVQATTFSSLKANFR